MDVFDCLASLFLGITLLDKMDKSHDGLF